MNSLKKKKKYDIFPVREVRILLSALLILTVFPWPASAIDISDTPLDAQLNSAPANFMIVIDDSGSMDWEIMTKEQDGLFDIPTSNKTYGYIFDDPADYNLYQTGSYDILDGSNRLYWKSQWYGYNYLYYNPVMTYKPWVGLKNADGTDIANPNANPDNPKSHPYSTYTASGVSMSGEYTSVQDTGNITVSHLDAQRVTMSDSWSLDTQLSYRTGVSGKWLQYNPVFPSTKTYEVFIYVPTEYSNNTLGKFDTKAKYTITHADGTAVKTVNQGVRGWQSLGSYKFNEGASGTVKVERHDQSTDQYTIANSIKFVSSTTAVTVSIPNAHYYLYSKHVSHKPYLVIVNSGVIKYYEINDDGDNKVENGEITSVSSSSLPDDLQYQYDDTTGQRILVNGQPVPGPVKMAVDRGYTEERQNFANWYQFYRRRMFTATAAISDIIPKLKGIKVGLFSINEYIHQGVLPIDINGENKSADLLKLIHEFKQDTHPQSSTPLRKALEKIGQYYHKDDGKEIALLGPSPIADNGSGGDCQQNFVMIFSDGADNGQSPGIGDADKDMGVPYQDNPQTPASRIYPAPSKNDQSQANTLADVAMYYYKNDLAADVYNHVPTGGIDNNSKQHMVTYSVGFGITGSLDPNDYNPSNSIYPEPYDIYAFKETDRIYPNWPDYASNEADTAMRIDDMWHAGVNGHGKFLSAKNPEELIKAFNEVAADILKKTRSAASVAINGQEFTTTSAVYQSTYETKDWNGDVWASVITTTGRSSEFLWQANQRLYEQGWTNRKIITFDTKKKTGTPFVFSTDLKDSGQLALLDSDTATGGKASKILNYLRGDYANEQGETTGDNLFRRRVLRDDQGAEIRHSMLGDIVHSAPLYQDNVLYVGGNDGMLHAFRASGATKEILDSNGQTKVVAADDEGKEIFAYVPSHVFANLKELSVPDYEHLYYVDLTPFAKKISSSQTLLVGGLGKGGKGIYCLDISGVSGFGSKTEAEIANSVVKWEFPNKDTSAEDVADMGYSFSKPYIVKVKGSSGPRWVVIFGNGYSTDANNTHRSALFILDALTGSVLKKIPAGVGGDNGLSTTNPVDVDGDGYYDYVYAGDLKGNMWKFNIKDADETKWGLSYNKALFTAMGPSNKIQPITSRPDAMLHCQADLPGYMVIFGTGKFLAKDDIASTDVQTIYGVWDYGDDTDPSEYLGEFDRSTKKPKNQPMASLLEQEEIFFNSAITQVESVDADGNPIKVAQTQPTIVRVLSDNTPVWKTEPDSTSGEKPNPSTTEYNNVGWFFDLPKSGERVYQDIIIRSGGALVISSIPKPDQTQFCQTSGESIFHEMDACAGGRRKKGHLDIKPDGKIDDQDLVEVTIDGNKVYVSATGVYNPNLIYPPAIMNAGDGSEIKIFSTSTADISLLREKAEKKGIFYWRSY
ncbi:PilC/PilY family type IV pilus protein [Desulforegula conservatrix]|uniref:PilC/PilY family type IV pilus protein n=1 Tax=Desulforegula conservatrix TaxID=153026 RepID=UPI0004021F91|nr:PilC/PilY family type IV pilus protein [Desulforegula conservatrix]